MLQLGLFDPHGRMAETIAEYTFWDELTDINYLGKLSISKLEKYISNSDIDIIIAVTSAKTFSHIDFIKKVLSTYTEIAVIIISDNLDYAAVRKAFLMGAADYISLCERDKIQKRLKKTLINISSRITDAYFSEKIYDKIKTLASHIFDGGDDVYALVGDMVDTVYDDWGGNDIVCRQVAERIKLESYKLFVRTKPWLEKFIYRSDYVSEIGFELRSRDEIKSELSRYYSEIDLLFKKYNVIDVNKTIYTIGKSVINNIDEKVSLDFVASDVFMNKTYISHIFKKMTGISFNDFLLDVKVERSKILLHYPEMTVTEIAGIMNFSSSGYFAAKFKEFTHLTPTEYRESLKEKPM